MPTDSTKNLFQVPSLETTDNLRIFRNFFVHIKGNSEGSGANWELGEPVVWEQDNVLMRNLSVVLKEELGNVSELTDFEDGL